MLAFPSVGQPVVEAAPAKPWRARLITAVRIIAALGIVYFIVATTVDQWPAVQATFRDLPWLSLIASLVAAVARRCGSTMMAWRSMVGSIDHPLRVRDAAPIMLVGSLGKYLPGSVWAYVVQMELGRRAGVSRSKVFIGSVLVSGIGVTIGLILTAPGFGTAFDGVRASGHEVFGSLAVWASIILLPFAVVVLLPAAADLDRRPGDAGAAPPAAGPADHLAADPVEHRLVRRRIPRRRACTCGCWCARSCRAWTAWPAASSRWRWR